MKGIIIVLFILVGGSSLSNYTDFDPIYCLQVLNSLFNPVEEETTCEKTAQLITCAKQFFPSESDHSIIKGLESIIEDEVCSHAYEEDSENVNKCLSHERFHLFSCVYKYMNLEFTNSDVDSKILKCKRAWSTGECEDLVAPCTARASYISRQLFHKFAILMTYSSFCGDYTLHEVERLSREPLNTEYDDLALCLDEKISDVTQCLSEAVSSKFSKKMSNHCRPIDPLVNCIKGIVRSHCESLIGKLKKVAKFMKQQIEQVCPMAIDIEYSTLSTVNNNPTVHIPLSETTKNNNTQSDQDQRVQPTTQDNEPVVPIPFIKVVNNNPQSDKDQTVQPTTQDNKSFDHLPFTKVINNNPKSDQYRTIKPTTQENTHTYSNGVQDPMLSTTLKENILKSLKILSVNTSVAPSNATDPIVIHKHTLVTVFYKPKSGSSVIFNSINVLIEALVVFHFVYLFAFK